MLVEGMPVSFLEQISLMSLLQVIMLILPSSKLISSTGGSNLGLLLMVSSPSLLSIT